MPSRLLKFSMAVWTTTIKVRLFKEEHMYGLFKRYSDVYSEESPCDGYFHFGFDVTFLTVVRFEMFSLVEKI